MQTMNTTSANQNVRSSKSCHRSNPVLADVGSGVGGSSDPAVAVAAATAARQTTPKRGRPPKDEPYVPLAPILLTPQRVAELICTSLSAARLLMLNGSIRTVVIPGRVPKAKKQTRRARREDVEAFIQRNLSRPAPPVRHTANMVHTPRGDYKRYV